MTSKHTEVFLPIKLSTYKESKVNLLKTQMKTVASFERLQRIKEIQKIKKEQRRLLKSCIKEIKQYYNRIKKALPTDQEIQISGRAPMQIIAPLESKITTEEKIKKQFERKSKLDQELEKIQDKIKNLKL